MGRELARLPIGRNLRTPEMEDGMKLQIDLDEGSELLQTLHRIEATIDGLLEVWNSLVEVSTENLGDLEVVRESVKDGVTIWY